MQNPPVERLSKLTPGQKADFYAILAEKTRGATRDGKPFFTCRFRDNDRTVACMIWADSTWFDACLGEWRAGHFFKIRATYLEHPSYGPQIELQNIRHVADTDREAGFEPLEFIERTRFDVDAMFAEIVEIAQTEIQNEPLSRLAVTLLQTHGEKLKTLPATMRNFHPYAGGLLEHILSVTRSCRMLVDRYLEHYADTQPQLNRDLVLAGAMLHDLGRVVELDDSIANPQQTVLGRLVGHVILGRDLMRDQARAQGDVDPELVDRLEHIILSHLTRPEWGSPRLPMLPECLILHHADDLDAKLEMFLRCLRNDQEPGPFTARDPVLGKALFKGRPPATDASQ